MRENDGINRFVIENSDVRGLLVHLDDTWLIAKERMEYPGPVRQVLGEAFAAAVLLSATIKFDGKMTLQIRGDGAVHLLVVQVTNQGTVRGLARWSEIPTGDLLDDMFGKNARMTISVEADALGQPHQGIVELIGDNLGEALRNYFQTSEQLQTRLYLAVSDKSAAGMLLQKLPGSGRQTGSSEDGSEDASADADGWDRSVKLADTILDEELLSLDAKSLLHRLYHEEQVRLFEPAAVSFECSCSRERTDGVIQGLGEVEAASILKEQGCISITCEFCAANYSYDSVDISLLFRSSVSGENPDTLH